MTIKALGKKIIIDLVELELKKDSILIIPNDRKMLTGVVIAMGIEVDDGLEVGDVVFMLPESGIEVKINGYVYYSIVEHQIIAAWRQH